MKKTILFTILLLLTFNFAFSKGIEKSSNESLVFSNKIENTSQSKPASFFCDHVLYVVLTEDCGDGTTNSSIYFYCPEDPLNGALIRFGECGPIPPPQP